MFLIEKKVKGLFWHHQNLMFLLSFSGKHRDLRKVGKSPSISRLRKIRIFSIYQFCLIFLTQKKWEKIQNEKHRSQFCKDLQIVLCFPYVFPIFLKFSSYVFPMFLIYSSGFSLMFLLYFSYVFFLRNIWDVFLCFGGDFFKI